MSQAIIKNLLLGFLTLWSVSILVFVSTEILPGDLASAVLGQDATEESLSALRNRLQLDRPPVERYLDWLASFIKGDLGSSLVSGRPVGALLADRLANTLLLAGYATTVTVPLAIGAGLWLSLKVGTAADRLINAAALFAMSLPEYLVAYLLISFFAVQLGWLPAISSFDVARGGAAHLILPVATLCIATMGQMMRMTRTVLIEVLQSPYIEMAVLKGVSPARVVLVHALPNAVGAIAAVTALNIAYLIVGVIVVEVVFAYPGIGQLMIDSVTNRDVPLVQACALVFACTYISLNTAADIVSLLANPRLRLSR